MSPFRILLLAVASLLFLGSCEKVIDLDLNASDRRLVIEAQLNSDGLCYVKLSKVNNYDESNTFPAVSDAIVQLTDNAGNTWLLPESANQAGYYAIDSFPSVPGRTYVLQITSEGKQYTSTSTMPEMVVIDSLTTQKEVFFIDTSLVTICHYQDPASQTNYYRYLFAVNQNFESSYLLDNDVLFNGQHVKNRLVTFGPEQPEAGDTIYVGLMGIDRASYDYYSTLQTAIDGASGQQAAPANPISRFSNGAMGYFVAYTFSQAALILTE